MDLNQHVLIVDDSKIMRKIINDFLQRMGITVIIEAANGREALQVIADKDIDLVISDWSMQGMTGFDILKAIRQDIQVRELPFIMITAEGQLFHVLKAFRAGVDQYLIKPFDFKQFKYVLKKIL